MHSERAVLCIEPVTMIYAIPASRSTETCKSVQTANRTKELAANTLEELERQGDKLEAIDRDLHAVSSKSS